MLLSQLLQYLHPVLLFYTFFLQCFSGQMLNMRADKTQHVYMAGRRCLAIIALTIIFYSSVPSASNIKPHVSHNTCTCPKLYVCQLWLHNIHQFQLNIESLGSLKRISAKSQETCIIESVGGTVVCVAALVG